jgi:hypothetical protein
LLDNLTKQTHLNIKTFIYSIQHKAFMPRKNLINQILVPLSAEFGVENCNQHLTISRHPDLIQTANAYWSLK